MRHRFLVPLIAVSVSLALLASACSSSDSKNRSAAGESAGDPTTLGALPSASGSGERTPLYFGAVVTPSSWISTSLSPTLSVPGATGAWTFEISDLSGGTSAFGTKVYAEPGSSSRIPLGAGLEQGHVYTWTARNTSGSEEGVVGSFQIDVQQSAAQVFDSVGDVSVGLSSGEASYEWSSHSVSSLPGSVGFGVQFQASNRDQVGMPKGWTMQAASSSPYRQVIVNEDESVALESLDGTITTYRVGQDGSLDPVRTGIGSAVDVTGLAPVLVRNADGTFAVTSKNSTSVFTLEDDQKIAYLSGVSSADEPTLAQRWNDGRLQSVTDPVSGRELTFVYGGGDCPRPASGFVVAPKGMLCEVRFWDGSTSAIFYVDTATGPSIGRLVDWPEARGAGAQVTDLAYDASGRIARTRLPLVAQAVAANLVSEDDSEFWSEVLYDSDGRVAKITQSAPEKGATRCANTYEFGTSVSQVTDTCLGRPILTVEFDPSTFFPLESENELGQRSRSSWDLASGQLMSTVDYQGLVTINRFQNGNLVSSTGPTRGPLDLAQTTLYEYDQQFDASMGATPMRGLDVTYFPSANDATTDGRQELGPIVDGTLVPSLTVNWDSAPVGNRGWSAIMTGTLNVRTAGEYKIESGNSTARVSVNNVACSNGGCNSLPLQSGANSIRVDVSSEDSRASMDISWSGPDTGGVLTSIPTNVLGPQYGFTTTTKSFDPTAKRSPAETSSRSVYANPAAGRLSARVNQTGSETSLDYEQKSGGKGGWGRQIATTGAGDATYTFTYWGDRESAKPPCPNASSINQGGAAKEVATPGPDGVPNVASTQWVDAGGRVLANKAAGGVITCNTFGPGARMISTQLLNTGTPWKAEYDDAVGGNPLLRGTTETRGDEVTTTVTEIDLHGRTIRSVDRFGVETRTTYDIRTGGVATTTVTAPLAAPTVTEIVYNDLGQSVALKFNGRVLASATYYVDGTIASLAYGNGVKVSQSYDDSLTLNNREWTGSAGNFATTRDISSGGKISAESLVSPSGSSTFTYAYDSNGRLSSASITEGLVKKSRSWQWSFDNSSNRISQKIFEDAAVIGDYTYSYNKGSQLLATNDPAASDGVEYDSRGNATKVGPDRFEYDIANRLVGATDGTISVAYLRDIGGGIVSKTTTNNGESNTLHYAAGGILLNGDKNATAQIIDLPGGAQFTASLGTSLQSQWMFQTIGGNEFFTTTDSGTLVGEPQVFDPYGQRLTAARPAQPGLPSATWQADTGNETESLKTAYQVMGTRPYIPALGRFLQPDSKVGGSANQYDFASQDPVNLSDPSGEDISDSVAPIATAVATIAAMFLFKVSSVRTGLLIGGLIGAASASISAAIDYSNNNLSAWSAIRAGYTVLAGLAVGGGTVAARNKWVSAAKSKQVVPAPAEAPAVSLPKAKVYKEVQAPPCYARLETRLEWERQYRREWMARQPNIRRKIGDPKGISNRYQRDLAAKRAASANMRSIPQVKYEVDMWWRTPGNAAKYPQLLIATPGWS